MKNSFGSAITVTLFGESHGECVGAVIDGLPGGIIIDEDDIAKEMKKRQGIAEISTPRKEEDKVEFLSGVLNGYSEGTPLTLIIRNQNTRSSDYSQMQEIARPSHADYTAEVKYHGYQDVRGGGHFSGRLTAALVAAGAILKKALEDKGIYIGSHIARLHGIEDENFHDDILEDIHLLNHKEFPALNQEAEAKMIECIKEARDRSDSVGGILESAIFGLEAGIGEPFFDSVESVLAHAMLAVPGIKGISFGAGFALADMYGSEANDPFEIRNGKVQTVTNHSGGINGGISNGMPVIFSTVVKPTASIAQLQKTVNFKKMEDTELLIHGRHDPAIIHRARAVVDAMSAICIADLLAQRYGYEYLRSQR